MARTCHACSHPKVDSINEALLLGRSKASVGRAFGIDHRAVTRHWRNHVPEQVKAAAASARAAEGPPRLSADAVHGEVLLGQAARILQAATDMFGDLYERMDAGEDVDTRSVVASLREWRSALESMSKLTFAVQDRPAPVSASEQPALDAALKRALEARGFAVDDESFDTDESRNGRESLPALLPPSNTQFETT